MEDLETLLLECEEKMNKALDFLLQEFSGIRSGKASPAMVENISVEYYGTPTRIRELGGIATPEPRLLVITPYDPSILGTMEKAIIAANIGITPMNDGRVIRLPVPEPSEERRKEMMKMAGREAEEQRVAIRNVRREYNDLVKGLQKAGKTTEDLRDDTLQDIQKLTDDYIKKVDVALKSKEVEVMAV